MEQKSTNRLGIIVMVLVIGIVVAVALFSKPHTSKPLATSPTATSEVHLSETHVMYPGVEGKDALELLKELAPIEQDASGLVVSINNRKADSAKREYWAFYVNGKLSEVGPADYKPKSGDRIEWKIERY